MPPTEDERRGLADPVAHMHDATDDVPVQRDDPSAAPAVPEWDLLPPPHPRPVAAQAYQRPTHNAPDDVVVRLVSGVWFPFAMVFTFAAIAVPIMFVTSGALGLLPLLFALPFVIIGGFSWYRVASSPRLEVGAEGFVLTTYGLSRTSIDVPWADIVSLRLHARSLPRGGHVLHLFITPRPDGALASAGREVLDIPLGMTGIGKVNHALRMHRPPRYRVTGRAARFPWWFPA